nr:Gag-Pol polyprotein [Tanacetum cinerariifolium]
RATIAKSSTLPHDSAPRVTSPAADEDSMQQPISELTALCTSLQSEVAPTASPIVTSYSRRKGKEVMVESDTLKKQRLQEQIDAQSQQRMPMTKKQKRDYYMAMIRKNLGWKVKDFKGMTFKEIEAKFDVVWKHVEDFIPIGSKEEAERLKRNGLNLEQEYVKKQKTLEEALEIEKSTKEIPEEKMKEMMQLRSYSKIITLGGSSACYHFFIDLLKQMDMEDLIQLWALVMEYLSIRPATSEKEMELWVELKRLYEPDLEDQLWTQTQNFMHVPVEWKLYDLCGVHQVTAKDKDIFMLVEKYYPLRKGLAIVMISYKLQVETYSRMANELVLKIYKIANADHVGCLDTHKSTSGGVQFLGDKLVSWMLKKQDYTAMSSAEVEYVALSASCA